MASTARTATSPATSRSPEHRLSICLEAAHPGLRHQQVFQSATPAPPATMTAPSTASTGTRYLRPRHRPTVRPHKGDLRNAATPLLEPEDWREAQARTAHALDKLRTDRKQQHDLTRHVAEHAQEALECGATREQIAEALGMGEHASPVGLRRHGR